MQVVVADRLAFLRVCRLANEDAVHKRAKAVNSEYDLNGIGRLCVEYTSREAALSAIARVLDDAEKDHAATWNYYVTEDAHHRVTVTYAVGHAVTDFDDPDKTPPGHKRVQ